VTTSGTTIIKSIVLRVTTLVENSTSPSPWLARIGRTARAGVADCTIKVLNSAVGKFFAVNIRIANITLLPIMSSPKSFNFRLFFKYLPHKTEQKMYDSHCILY